MDDLYYLFDAYEEDPEVRVIVLTGGDGKAFCAGGDVKAMAAQNANQNTAICTV